MADCAVYVDSRGGNTRNVADAIAAEVHAVAGDLALPLPADEKILFLGSGTYGSAPGIEMMKFVTDNGFEGRKVALFGTSLTEAGAKKMIAALEDALSRKGATILGSYHCRGSFLVFSRGRPHAEDLENARTFAREMLREGRTGTG